MMHSIPITLKKTISIGQGLWALKACSNGARIFQPFQAFFVTRNHRQQQQQHPDWKLRIIINPTIICVVVGKQIRKIPEIYVILTTALEN